MIRPDRRLAQVIYRGKKWWLMICDGCCKGHAGPAVLPGIARLEGERGGGMYRPKKSQEIDDQTRPASCPA
jgi:hypothetical protein